MKFDYGSEAVEFFVVHPRSMHAENYWKHIENVIAWSDKHGATGVLLFEGNDTLVQPWLAAYATFANSKNLSPLVAVNPVYMHPYTTAKMVSSNAYLFGRKTYLNMITGTALSYLDALNDQLDKEQRYDRLREYAELVTQLTSSGGQPVTYEGEYYKTKAVKLEPAMPANLQPVFFIEGAVGICAGNGSCDWRGSHANATVATRGRTGSDSGRRNGRMCCVESLSSYMGAKH